MAKGKNNSGFVRMYRSIWKHPIWTSSEPFDRRSAFWDLIMMANHEETTITLRDGTRQKIGRGQLFTSIDNLMIRWHWKSRNKVVRYLDLLSAYDMAHSLGTRRGTLVTIVNYTKYQGRKNSNELPDGLSDESSDELSDESRTNNLERTNRKNEKKEAAPPFKISSSGRIIE